MRMMHRRPSLLLSLIVGLVLGGCQSSSAVPVVAEGPGDDVGYGEGSDVVVVDDVTYVVTDAGEDCVMLGDDCVDIEDLKGKYCSDPDAQADVVIVDGEVIEVICYPPVSSGISVLDVERTADGTAQVPQNENNTVVTFDETTDGVPIEGNIDLQAENIALIGNGVDQTIIDGNVTINSNNARIRGLTIDGNLTLQKNTNTAAIAFCKITGNLEIHANNVSVVSCEVFGNLKVDGNNISLIRVGVGGDFNVVAAEVCEDNYAFEDDGDLLVTDDEVGDPLTCTPE